MKPVGSSSYLALPGERRLLFATLRAESQPAACRTDVRALPLAGEEGYCAQATDQDNLVFGETPLVAAAFAGSLAADPSLSQQVFDDLSAIDDLDWPIARRHQFLVGDPIPMQW